MGFEDDEAVGVEHGADYVRALAAGRTHPELAVLVAQGRAHVLAAVAVVGAGAFHPGGRLGQKPRRLRMAGGLADGGAHELEKGHHARYWVAGQAEIGHAADHAKDQRLARLHGDAPKDRFAPQIVEDLFDEVVFADRDAARGGGKVSADRGLNGGADRGLVVRDCGQHHWFGPVGAAKGG